MLCFQVPRHMLLSVKSINLSQQGKQMRFEQLYRYSLRDSSCALPARLTNCLCLSVTRRALLSHLSCSCMPFSRTALIYCESIALLKPAFRQESGLYLCAGWSSVACQAARQQGCQHPHPQARPCRSWKGCACLSFPFCKRRCGQRKGNTCRSLHPRKGSSLCCTGFPCQPPCSRKQSGNSLC
jgi:hypothetical protein